MLECINLFTDNTASNTASVKSAHAMSTWLFQISSIKEHLTSIVGLEG
jgi:hypothetical protein